MSVKIAAVGDLHCGATSRGSLAPQLARAVDGAKVLVLCGDLTDLGQPDEARVLAQELSNVPAPVVAVLGNHDHESGAGGDVRRILVDAGVHVLEGESVEVNGIGFAGTKGFAGGFGRRALGAWGEAAIKHFVQEALDEAMKLEEALARLRTPLRVAVLHYAPIVDTVVGEPEQIYAFLGSSRLEDPIDRYGASLVVHGHAHVGSLEGRTRAGVPVYNVSLPLLRANGYDPPVRVFHLEPTSEHSEAGRAIVA
jgi:Icc-related predicted phosphoesterase